jgi:ABC-type sulfate/molybdate transport systems ATPase subunit
MSLLTVHKISQKHGDDFTLHEVSFSQEAGQKIAIAGETGSGKTSLMKIIGGHGQADSGEVYFEGGIVPGLYEKLIPGHSGIAYLSQHFDIRNKYRVSELLAYANNLTDEQSAQLYRVCRVDHLLQRWSHTLSGGEKQRVALAKLLTETPRLLLLDEPFSNLDLIHKQQLKRVIDDISAQLSVTCMMISHDGQDILPWADEVLIMQAGQVIAQAPPMQLYRQPRSEYIAGLFGRYNRLSPELAAAFGVAAGTILRPEAFRISHTGVKGFVRRSLYYGSHYELEVAIGNEVLLISTEQPADKGTAIDLQLKENPQRNIVVNL